MSTLNISSDIAYFFEQYDTLAATPSPLSTFALDFGTGLTDWVNATSIQLPITSISSTSIVASDGLDHSLTLSGSGFDPVTSAAALEAAISNGLANGSFTRIAIDGPATIGAAPSTLMTIDITPAGYTMTSGNQSISVTGSMPTTMADIFNLADAFGRASSPSLLTPAERTQLITDLSAFGVTGFEIADGGVTLFQVSSTSSQIVFSVDGYTSTLSGTFPTDFGQSMAVVFDAMDMSNAGAVFTTIADINTIPGITLSSFSMTDPAGAILIDTTGDLSTGAVTVLIDGIAPPTIDNVDMDFSGNDTMAGLQDFFGTQPYNDYLLGLTGDDTINAGTGDDLVFGGTGNDVIFGEAGNDVLFGNAGDDWLEGNEGSDTLNGGAGWDLAFYNKDNSIGATGITASLVTGLVTDTTGGTDTLISIEGIVGSNFDDSITGGDLNDSLFGEAGNDTLNGGAGDDWLAGREGSDTLNGGAGWDIASYLFDNYTGATTGITASLATGLVTDTTGGTDTLISIERIIGSNFDDSITGGDQNDDLFGEAGNDMLFGGAGDDWLEGGDGNDTMDGGAGTDTALFLGLNFADAAITVTYGTVTVASGGFTDTLTNVEVFQFADGARGILDLLSTSQSVPGTVGNDNITGGSAADTLNGGAGNDEMSGGAGDDTIDGGDGDDVIIDGLGNDQITGGAGSDSITVLSGNNTVSGGVGSDFLIGGFQTDNLDGGAGADVIIGDGAGGFLSGSDRITGGTGDDMMMGSGGADTFVFAINDGADTIAAFNAADVVFSAATGYSATPTGADFTSGIDHIELVGFAGIDATNVMGSVTTGADGAVFSASGTSITFFGVDVADLSADDFIFV